MVNRQIRQRRTASARAPPTNGTIRRRFRAYHDLEEQNHMPIRIALAGFAHETNTFAPWPTDLADFEANGFYRGHELVELEHSNTVIGGAVKAARADAGVELIPIVATSAIPSGLVTTAAADAVEGAIFDALSVEKPDAVVLDLHGAMVTERDDDGEAGTLRRVRDAIGPETPVVIVLDLHANLSEEMVALSTVVIPYNTYPHVDNAERGAEALTLAARIARGEIKPTAALARLPMISACPKQFSHAEPTSSIMAKAFEMEALPGVLNVGVTFAFGYADTPINGMAVVVTTDDDRELADRLARELSLFIWDRREEFRPVSITVEEAVHRAMEAPEGPIVLADTGDNPGGGSACDGTALVWGLLDLGADNAAVALIADPEVVQQAIDVGVGGRLETMLGAKADDLHGYPIPIKATVRSLSDGNFTYEGPMDAGVENTLGRTAVLACEGRHGNVVEVIVAERRVQPYDLAVFRSQGIEPTERKILVVKSVVHFRGAFMPIAKEVIEVDTPGLTSIDYGRFTYERLPRPMWPLDPI
jgi:microcystin degradation protein MlrC